MHCLAEADRVQFLTNRITFLADEYRYCPLPDERGHERDDGNQQRDRPHDQGGPRARRQCSNGLRGVRLLRHSWWRRKKRLPHHSFGGQHVTDAIFKMTLPVRVLDSASKA